MTAPRACHYCEWDGDEPDDLRPYGPGGTWVCFPCAMENREREEATGAAFGALLDAAAAVGPLSAIGEPDGPRPFDPREAAGIDLGDGT